MAESDEGLQSLLMEMKEESEKAGLKLTTPEIKIMASSRITSWQIEWKKQKQDFQILFSQALKSLQMVTTSMKLKDTPWKESYGKPRQCIKKERRHFADKSPYSQRYGFSSSHVQM